MNIHVIVEGLLHDEGVGLPGKPGLAYTDSVGKVTVGCGRNLEDVGVTFAELSQILSPAGKHNFVDKAAVETEAQMRIDKRVCRFPSPSAFHRILGKPRLTDDDIELLLMKDIKRSVKDAENFYGDDWGVLPGEAQDVIVQVLFNLGLQGYMQFRKHIAAVRARAWHTAADELLDSRAARQTGQRYKRYADTLRGLA